MNTDKKYGGASASGAATVPASRAAKPQRLQLSRRKGFNLQAASRAVNGLPAVNVARPSDWGNPYTVEEFGRDQAIRQFRYLIEKYNLEPKIRAELRGKNLACWCRPGQPCHADLLLQIANARSRSRGRKSLIHVDKSTMLNI